MAIKFFPLQMKYDQMSTHLSRAGISPFENHWDNVHDFTPSEDSQSNWQVSPYELDMCQVFELNADQFACGDADKFDFTDTLRWFYWLIYLTFLIFSKPEKCSSLGMSSRKLITFNKFCTAVFVLIVLLYICFVI